MDIIKFKKVGMDKYKVYLDDSEFILYEDVILKYNLLTNPNISISKLESIIEENKFYEVYNVALKYISIKLRSKKELIIYLENKSFSADLIDRAIERLEAHGYLNETVYIEAFINDSVNLKNDGPYKIKSNLINMGICENLIDKHINEIESDVWKDKIRKHICKAVNLNKKYSSGILKQKIMYDLYIKGYDREIIAEELENISINDEDNLKLEYKKAYKKFSKKYQGIELDNKIIVYLRAKGYNYNDMKQDF